MTEILLSLLNFSLIGLIVWLIKQYHEQEKRLVKAIMSKDVEEFTKAEIAERPEPKEKKSKEEDLIPLTELTDEQFDKLIHKK